MKAFALNSADRPAELMEVPDPAADDDGIVVRVRAASVNGLDLFQASGRFASMVPHDFPAVVGRDFAGVADAVGSQWTDVEVGDEVLGFVPSLPPLKAGTFAELDPGDVVVVIGATGGVGSFAVQLAAARGARVVATAHAGEEADLMTSLGAAETVDYADGDLVARLRAAHPDGVAALIDLVNRGDEFASVAELVRDGGWAATTLGAADVDALAARGVTGTNVRGMPTPEMLASLADEVASARLRVVIQASYRLTAVQAALEAFSGGTLGKIVVTI